MRAESEEEPVEPDGAGHGQVDDGAAVGQFLQAQGGNGVGQPATSIVDGHPGHHGVGAGDEGGLSHLTGATVGSGVGRRSVDRWRYLLPRGSDRQDPVDAETTHVAGAVAVAVEVPVPIEGDDVQGVDHPDRLLVARDRVVAELDLLVGLHRPPERGQVRWLTQVDPQAIAVAENGFELVQATGQ